MSWLAGAALTAAVLALRGPAGRSPSAVAAVQPTARGAVHDPATGGRLWTAARSLRLGRRSPLGRGEPGLALVVTDVAGRLRSGADPQSAWREVLGAAVPPDGPSVDDLTRRPGERSEAAVVVVAGRLATELGAPLAPLLDGVARALAEHAEAEGDQRAALAGPRATARVLTGLPVLGVVLGTAVGADPVSVLLDGGVGSAALGVGVVLVLVGRAWTARLARSAVAASRAT